MLSAGIPKPRVALRITLAVSVLSWLSVAWGAAEMAGTGKETTRTAAMIGIALLPAILGPLMALNIWWAVRIVTALRRGEGVVGRWRLTTGEIGTFVAEDRNRSLRGLEYINDWTAPRRPPSDGVEIIFGKDGVVAHDAYFTLSKAGFYTFRGVHILAHSPLSIEFATTATTVSGATAIAVRRTPGALRFPIPRADDPEVLKVLEHYRRPETGTIAANRDFYSSRMRFGLIAGPVCLLFAGAGFALQLLIAGDDILPMLMMIFGGVFGVAALLLAGIAAFIGRAKRTRS
jgi:hypothetical protein